MQAIQVSEAKTLHRTSRVVYNISLFALFLLFIWLSYLTRHLPGPIWEWVRHHTYLLTCIAFLGAQVITHFVSRWLGVSLAGKTLHTIRRGQSGELFPIQETASIRPDFARKTLPIALPVLILIGVSQINSLQIQDKPVQFDWVIIALAVSILAALCTAPFSFLNRNKPILQVDDKGIAYCDPWGVRSGFIAWEEVEACELEVERNTVGTLVKQTFRFKDSNGKQLAVLSYSQDFLMKSPDNVSNSQRMERCWSLIQKRLTGASDESLVPPLELAPRETAEITAPTAPTIPLPRVIERDARLSDETRHIEKPLIISAGIGRYLAAIGFTLMPAFILLALRNVNPVYPDSWNPAAYNHTFFEGWPIWLIMSGVIFAIVCLFISLILATFWWQSITKPNLVIDDEGISYRAFEDREPVMLKWEHIALCEVQSSRLLDGALTTSIFLKDKDGGLLLKMNIDFNTQATNLKNAWRVADVIEQYLTGRIPSAVR